MNLKSMSDEMVLQSSKKARQTECEALTSILHHLRENERRRRPGNILTGNINNDLSISRGPAQASGWIKFTVGGVKREALDPTDGHVFPRCYLGGRGIVGSDRIVPIVRPRLPKRQ